MAATVRIDFKIGGEDAVRRAVQSIIQNATRSEKAAAQQQVATIKSVHSTRVKAANDDATLHKEAVTKAVAAEKAKLEAARDTSRERIAMIKATGTREAAVIKSSTALHIQAEKTKRDESRKTSQEDSTARRKTITEGRERDRASTRLAAAQQKVASGTRAGLADAVKRGGASGVGIVGAGAALAGGYLGTSTIIDAARSQLSLGKRSALLQNATDTSADYAGRAKGISNIVGEDAGDVMSGLEKIAGKAGKQGILETKDYMVELAKVAKGAGVSMSDLGDVTATLVNRGIKGKDLVKTVESLVQQGKDGAVEFKDLATMLDASSGALGRFSMNQGDRILSAGGLSQLARTYGKKSPEEATNAVEDLARDLGGKADIVQRLTGGTVKGTRMLGGKKVQTLGGGVEVGTDSTRAQLRDINTLLPEILEKAFKQGNAGKLMGEGGVFTGSSTSIIAPLMQAFNKGIVKNESGRFELAGDGQTASMTGKAAVSEMLKQFNGGAVEAGASAKAFANVMATQGESMNLAMTRLKNELGDRLAPEIAKATPKVVELISAFGKATAWAIDNPGKAITAVIAASMAKSLAGTMFDKLIDGMFAKPVPVMNVTAGSVNMAGGAPGVGGAGGGLAGQSGLAIGGAVLAGAALAYAGSTSIIGQLEGSQKSAGEGSALSGLNAASALSGGKGTDAEKTAAVEALFALKEEQRKGMGGRFIEEAVGGVTNIAQGKDGGWKNPTNYLRSIPQVAAMTGIAGALSGDKAAEVNKGLQDEAIKALEAALLKPKPQDDVVAAINGLRDTVAASALQGPKVPTP